MTDYKAALDSAPNAITAYTPELNNAYVGMNGDEWVIINGVANDGVTGDFVVDSELICSPNHLEASIVVDPSMRISRISPSYLTLNSLPPIDSCCNQYAGLDVFGFINTHNIVPELDSWKHAIDNAVAKRDPYAIAGPDSTGQNNWCLRVIPKFEHGELACVAVDVQITAAYPPTAPSNEQLDADDTYQTLVEAVKDYAISMLDTRGNVKTWNAGATLMKGYKPEEIIGRHFSTFYCDEDIKAQKPKKDLEICLREGKMKDESRRYRKDGSSFWVNVTITPMYRKGIHIGFSEITRDLTEQKATESRLVSAYEASKLTPSYIANMSNEIRTPINAVIGMSGLLMDSPGLTQDQREIGDAIAKSGTTLLRMTDSIIDHSRISLGRLSLCPGEMRIPDIIASIVGGFQTTLKSGVTLEASLGPDTPKCATGDTFRYRQVIETFLENSSKFIQTGSIHINVSVPCADEDSYTILTEVTDTGSSIPAHEATSLFNPLTLLRGANSGLYVCKGKVELMGGEIGYRPNPNPQGSIFWFTTKLQKISEPKQAQLESPIGGINTSTLHDLLPIMRQIAPGKRLLLAEDNKINQKLMLKILNKLGFEHVDTAMNGEIAVNLVLENPDVIDLIFMDVSMPVLDGLHATHKIREAGVNIPIIGMVATQIKKDSDAVLAHGMDGWIRKPFRQMAVLETLSAWLKM